MKIKNYAIDWPSKLKIPFTKQERKFIDFLQLSDDFEKQIVEIRRKYDIPLSGFSTDREHEIGLGIPKYLDDNKWDQYLEDESIIADSFGFTGTWGLSLSYFIKYNYMPKFANKIEPRAAIFNGEITLNMLQHDYPSLLKRRLCISINQKLSKKQFKSLIDLQWNQIEEGMKNLPAWDLKKHTNLEIYKEIKRLKKRINITWDEIATSLFYKFPENDKVLDESYIRLLFNRYSKRIKKLSKTSVSLDN